MAARRSSSPIVCPRSATPTRSWSWTTARSSSRAATTSSSPAKASTTTSTARSSRRRSPRLCSPATVHERRRYPPLVHSFRFAVQLARASSGEGWAQMARRAESLGYDVLAMPDHLGNQLSPLAALSAAAAATTRLRICAFVFANDYRHPLMLAREAATLDLLSGGRFE